MSNFLGSVQFACAFIWWGRISELKKAEGDPEKIRASLDESERLLTADLGLADKMHGREA